MGHDEATEQKRAEEALRESAERFRFTVRAVGITLFHQGADLRYTWIDNAQAGYLSEDLIGQIEEENDSFALNMGTLLHVKRQVLATGQGTRIEVCKRADTGRKEYYEVSLGPLRDAAGAVVGLIGAALNITERKQAEEGLRESEERLGLAIEAGRLGLWDWDVRNHTLVWNRYHEIIFGYAPGTPHRSYKDFADRVHPDDLPAIEAGFRKAMAERTEYRFQHRVVWPDGSVRWVQSHGRFYYDSADQPVRSLGVLTDITEQKKLETELRCRMEALAEADRRKDEFLAMLAHELRNPLAPIRNAVGVMKMLGTQERTLLQARDLIDRQVGHMARLIDDLLDVSRITRGKILLRKERLDLVPLVRTTGEDHRPGLEKAGLRFDVELPDQPVWVQGDPTRLSQMVGNLLHNAAKFTDSGGRIELCLTTDPRRGQVVLRVQDTGIGMDRPTLGKLFEPFIQADRSLARSRGGLGLGLALVKGLVALHGGTVTADSPGLSQGSTFTLQLPLARAPAVLPEPAGLKQERSRSLRILVVEDNRDAADSLRLLLELAGHEIAVAETGVAGLERAREIHPDVVLCDIGLPGGMDGYALARALRADSSLFEVALIALSGYGQEEDQRQARQAGFDRHLTKPVDPATLTQLLEALAGRRVG